MIKSPQIQSRINTIAKELASGKERAEILRKYAKKWQVAERTIDRYLPKAKQIATSIAKRADKVAEDTMDAVVKEAVKNGLKSVIEIDLKVQEIIFKPYQLIRDGNRIIKVENSTADQLRAADLYYRRHGHYAPERKDLTTKGLPLVSISQIEVVHSK